MNSTQLLGARVWRVSCPAQGFGTVIDVFILPTPLSPRCGVKWDGGYCTYQPFEDLSLDVLEETLATQSVPAA